MAEVLENRIGRYEVLGELGRGAMGIVYKARDPQLDRVVAIKTIRLDAGQAPEHQEDLRRRFYREAMAAARLNHPHIVGVYDVIENEGVPCIVMEYVEGQTLGRLLEAEAPLQPARAIDLVVQVCQALDYAHGRGIVHRDIKPANILVAGRRDVKVGDFGIARIADSKMTQTGTMLGSPSYMSPEQVLGREVDGRSDLFSLGVVLYETLTGADPFSASSPSTVLYKIVHEEPDPLPERNRAVTPALDAVIRRALAKDPARRYPTAQALADALAGALRADTGEGGTWERDTVVAERPAGGRRLRAAGMGAGCVLIAAAGGAWLWGTPSSRESPALGSARPAATQAPPAAAPPAPLGAETTRRTGPAAKRGTGRGSIAITTNPSVEIFVDGRFAGRVERSPFVIDRVAVGPRVVTLRLGPVEQRFRGTVFEDKPFALTYHFPPDASPGSRARP